MTVESSMIGNTFPQKNMMLRNWFLEPEEMKQISIGAATAAGGMTLTDLSADVTLDFRREKQVRFGFRRRRYELQTSAGKAVKVGGRLCIVLLQLLIR